MIEVGEYVRTEEGFIFKVTGIKYDEDWKDNWLKGDQDCLGDWQDYIIKHSKNIIDLIEVGDYVNGKKVTKTNLDKTMNGETAILCGDSNYDCLDVIYKNCDIKSIVTKEQFTNIEYRLEETND